MVPGPALFYAGGTAVHINSGAAAPAMVLVLRWRARWPGRTTRPHNLPFVMLGAGILWFGWFGFNGGSALAAGNAASVVVLNTFAATCSAMLAWLLVEKLRDDHAPSLGGASGAIAGLVAITPSCGALTPPGALATGAIGGALCALAVGLKYRFGFDDSLDVVGVHLVRSGRHAARRHPRHGRRPQRARRAALRRRPEAARPAGRRSPLGPRPLLRGHLAHRQGPGQGHRPAGHPGGR
jgi:ammonia channel protein AmtB